MSDFSIIDSLEVDKHIIGTTNLWFDLKEPFNPETYIKKVLLSFENDNEGKDICSICMDVFENNDIYKLNKCVDGHFFHKNCVISALTSTPKCPCCRQIYYRPTGNQPENGEMGIRLSSKLKIKDSICTFIIFYNFPDGIQTDLHPNPGVPYKGTKRTAYLPANMEGREILYKFMKAWDDRLIFTIGTSLTTGISNTIIWNNIHHKTSPTGGPTNFGYPDPTYFNRVNSELSDVGII